MPESAVTTAAPQFINFDAGRWDLYSHKAGADAAAADLTQTFNTLAAQAFMAMATNVPPCEAIAKIRQEMGKAMEKHSDFGASDSQYPLDTALVRVFGEELQSLGAPKPSRRSNPF